MAASVRIEDEAFSDRRYARLAKEAGLADADHARGKMAVLWRQCTIEQRHHLPVADVLDVLGERGVDALVASRLGELEGDLVRICGTSGRIEWLDKLRNNGRYGKLGGRPKKPTRVSEDEATRVEENAKPKTPPAPAPAQEEKRERVAPVGARAASGRKSKSEPTESEDADVTRVLSHLNALTNSNYQVTTHRPLLLARLRDGYTADDLEAVARFCATKLGWKSDAKMRVYLRPATLYGPQSITKYIDDARQYAGKSLHVVRAPVAVAQQVSIQTDWYAPPDPIGGFHSEEPS